MSIPFDRTINVGDDYKLYSKCSNKRKSVSFTVINHNTKYVYAAEWRYSDSPWQNGTYFYQYIDKDKQKIVSIDDTFQDFIVISFSGEQLKLKKKGTVQTTEDNNSESSFIRQAKICKNLFINKYSFEKSFPFNMIGLITGQKTHRFQSNPIIIIMPDQSLKEIQKKGQISFGTGFLLSKKFVLTCAHNVFDKEYEINNLKFHLKHQKIQIINVQVPQQYINGSDKQGRKYDFALLTLQKQVESLEEYHPFLQICYDYEQSCRATIIGFSMKQDQSKKAPKNFRDSIKQTGAIDYIGWIYDGLINNEITTDHGQSGSPVMTIINGKLKVIAIHIGHQKKDNRNMAVHLTKSVMNQINIWINLNKDASRLQNIQAISFQVFENQLSKNQKKILNANDQKMRKIKGAKARRMIKESKKWLLIGKKLFYDQKYQGAIYAYNTAQFMCKPNQRQQKATILAQMALTHIKRQTTIDEGKRKNRWQIISSPQYLSKKIKSKGQHKRKIIQQNIYYSKKNIKQLSKICSFKESLNYIFQSIKMFTILNQQNQVKLQKNTSIVNLLTNSSDQMIMEKKQSKIDDRQPSFLSILNYLGVQRQVLQDQNRKYNLQLILLKFEAGRAYICLKNLKKAEQIFQQLIKTIYPLIKITNNIQQIKYKYLLASTYIQLGQIYRKLDSSGLQKELQKIDYKMKIKVNQSVIYANNLELQIGEFGQFIQDLQDTKNIKSNEMYLNGIQKILVKLKQSNEIEEIEIQIFNLIILSSKYFIFLRQCKKLYRKKYLQIHSNLLQWLTFIYQVYQYRQQIQKIKELLYQSISKNIQSSLFQAMKAVIETDKYFTYQGQQHRIQ